MKALLTILLTSVLSFSLFLFSRAQSDSVTVTYREEVADSSSFSFKEKYDYFTRATVEETSMFRFGLSQIGFGGHYGLALEHTLGYERKLTKAISVLGQYRFGMSNWQQAHMGFDAAVRYYYSLLRRIRQQRSANNLSANYISLQLDNTWRGREPYVPGREGQTTYNSRFSLLYGIQRRLGKYGYFDVNAGISYYPQGGRMKLRDKFLFDVNFAIGLGF